MDRRPQHRIVVPDASPEEAAALVAALEQFLRDHAAVLPAESAAEPVSPWRDAALREGVNRSGAVGMHPPPFWA